MHIRHEELAALALYFPNGHAVHTPAVFAPMIALYVPAAQLLHCESHVYCLSLYVPTGHFPHARGAVNMKKLMLNGQQIPTFGFNS